MTREGVSKLRCFHVPYSCRVVSPTSKVPDNHNKIRDSPAANGGRPLGCPRLDQNQVTKLVKPLGQLAAAGELVTYGRKEGRKEGKLGNI